ncbi:MAG: fatty acid desaturase [Ignavibacteriaceae bacterium]|jgi:sphingolipid delta-4 desaturase|nr:fatty acid desaturase [Ignavibacteriaceae bacterium]
MEKEKKGFALSSSPEPHKERTRAILKSHPEVRELISRNPFSAVIIFFVVALQLTIAFLLSGYSWWIAPIIAFIVGAFANHSLYVLIHEACHNLIVKSRVGNMILSIIADIPNTLPSAISFRTYHLKHHSHQGDYYYDADLASHWEARLIGHSFIGKATWLFLFPVFQALRPPRLKINFASGWTFVNWIVVFGVDFLVIYFLGWTSFLYLLFSFMFSIGLHPLGARWIQEHYLTYPPQETYSYYGFLNVPALNVGFHNEHHDFPSIPWNKLPELKRRAPEHYDNLISHKSWSKLLWRFLTDSNLSLYSRMVRYDK